MFIYNNLNVYVVRSLIGGCIVGCREEAAPEHGCYCFHAPIPSCSMSVAREVWVSDHVGSLFEAATLVDPFDGGEVSTRDGLDSVHFLQFSLFLGV